MNAWIVLHAQGGVGEPGWILWTLVVGLSTAVVALAFYLAVKFLVWPGEKDREHIKHRIIEED